MNILVTGANGQLGNEMQRVAMLSAHQYTFTDVDTLDICDLDAVRAMVAQVKADVIVNCAAYTNVDKAETDSECADRINHLAVNNLAVAACEADATLIHISPTMCFPAPLPHHTMKIAPHSHLVCMEQQSSQANWR